MEVPGRKFCCPHKGAFNGTWQRMCALRVECDWAESGCEFSNVLDGFCKGFFFCVVVCTATPIG